MKRLKKRNSWKKRLLAWLLAVVMVSGNLSQAVYAAQTDTTVSTKNEKVIKISEKDIKRVLDKDPEDRRQLELKDIPFSGTARKQDILDELLSLTEGKILIKAQRDGTSLCLIYVEKDDVDFDFDGEDLVDDGESCLVDYLEIYTINAGDRPVTYKVELVSDTMVIEEAVSSEFRVVGDGEDVEIATNSNAQKATDSNAARPDGGGKGSGGSGSGGGHSSGANASGGTGDAAGEAEDQCQGAADATGGAEQGNAGNTAGDAADDVIDAGKDAGDAAGDAADAGNNTGDAAGNAADAGKDTSDTAGNAEDAGKDTGDAADNAADAGNNTGDAAGNAADAGKDTGDAADNAADAGNNTGDTGNAAGDAADTGNDTGNAAGGAADSGKDTGDSGDSGNSGDTADAADNDTNNDSGSAGSIAAVPGLSRSVKPIRLLTSADEEDEGAGLVSLAFEEDATDKVMEDLEAEGAIVFDSVPKNMIQMTRVKLAPATPFFEAVEKALGDPDDPADNDVVVGSVAIEPDRSGEIMAGEYFHFTVRYAMNAVPLYQFQGGTVSLYAPNEVKDGVIILTVPAQLVLPQQAGYRQENGDQAIYTIPITDGSASGEIVLNAYFDGNGKAAVGSTYELNDMVDVAYSGYVTATDPVDASATMDYAFCDYGQRESRDETPEETIYHWTLVTPDEWVVTKEILNKGGIGIPDTVDGTAAVRFDFEITVGLNASGQPAVGDSEYYRPGRAAFDTYTLTDTLTLYDKEGNPTDIKPLKLELKPAGEYGFDAADPVYGENVIRTGNYAASGYEGEATGLYRTDAGAPTLTRYKVTAYYERSHFGLDFFDPQVEDNTTYQVINHAEIQYTFVDVNDPAAGGSDDAAAGGYYQFVKGSSAIRLKKDLLIPAMGRDGSMTTETVPFNEKYGAFYEGYAGFTVEKYDEAEQTYVDYQPKVLSGGKYVDLEHVAINPVADSQDGDVPELGMGGSLTFFVEPGTYRITENVLPEKTAPSVHMDLDSEGRAYVEVTVTDNDDKTVTFENAVESGGLQFTKKGYAFENHELNTDAGKAVAVKGAEFTLYREDGSVEATAVSDIYGNVEFFPLDKGNYTLKETAVPDGYILDTAEYTVVVEAGRIARPAKGSQETPVIYNLPNRAAAQLVKWIANPESGERTRIASGIGAFDGRFRVEYQKADGSWQTFKDNISLGKDGDVTLDLPVYVDGKGDSAAPTTYRAVELVPDAYTSMSYGEGEFEQTYRPEGRMVISKTFQMAEPDTSTGLKVINITNILRGSIRLEKYQAGYADGGAGSVISTAKAGAGQAEFYLLKKDGDRYVTVKKAATDKNGNIAFSNLDVWALDGSRVQYYWYEAAQEGSRLEVFDAAHASGAKSMTFVASGVEIGGQVKDNVTIAGPFELAAGSETAAFAYNVAQKVPVWVHKKDQGTRENVVYDKNDPETQFEFSIWRTDETGEAVSGPVVVRNDGKPVYLDNGYTYKVRETKHPASYMGYVGDEVHKDADGYYQVIDLTNRGDVTMDSPAQENKGSNVITFVNQRLSRLLVEKYSRGVNIDSGLTTSDRLTDVSFEVYKRTGDGTPVFESTGIKLLSDDRGVWIEPGTYYVRETAVPGGHINPADYLEDGDHTDGDGLNYYKTGSEVYYGPIVVGTSGKEVAVGSIAVDNYKNLGTIQAIKRSYNLTEEDGSYKPLGGATIVLEKRVGAGYERVGTPQVSDPITGLVTFKNVPIYDNNGNRITYRLSETQAPAGYHLTDTRYFVTLDPGNPVTKKDVNGADLEFVNRMAVSLNVQKFWVDKWESQFAHQDVKNELPGVDLVLYSYKPGDETAKRERVAVSDQNSAAVSFAGLDSALAYFVVEGEGAGDFEPENGTMLLRKVDGAYPESLPVSRGADGTYKLAGNYNYADFQIQSGLVSDQYGEIINERPWVQFNLHKYADQIVYAEPGEGRTEVHFEYSGMDTFYAEPLDPNKDVNGAQFAFYETPLADGLNISLENYPLIDVYETGTKLDGLNGDQVNGEFDTTIVRPGNIFWLKEVKAGPGFSWGDRLQVIAFVPEDHMGDFELTDGYFTWADGTRVKVVPYAKNATAEADAYNYDMSGIGQGEILTAYVKLNKWLQTGSGGDASYTPLGGVTFELRVGGVTIASLETGLDNEWGSEPDEKTGQAMSEMLYFDEILAKLQAAGMSEEQINQWVDRENRTITFQLVEVNAPDQVGMMEGVKTLTVKFGGNSPVDTTYFYPDGERLINTQLDHYRAELRVWGYTPTEELFGACDGKITDAKLEELSGLDAEPLNKVVLRLYKFDYQKNKYVRYPVAGGIATQDGKYVFADGLPRGRYCLIEENMGGNSRYFNMFPLQGNNDNNIGGKNTFYREFTVNASERNVVNVYNPENPSVDITKRTLSGKTDGLNGLTITLKGAGTYNRTFTKNTGNTVEYIGINSGRYTITESGNPANTSVKYHGVYNENQLVIGFKRTKQNNVPQIEKQDAKKPYEFHVSMEFVNPEKGSLMLTKADAENPEMTLGGAAFRYSYLPFSGSDFEGSGKDSVVIRQNGPVTDAQLAAELGGRSGWGEPVSAGTTGEDGTLTLEGLDPGWYRVTEVTAPDHYAAAGEPVYIAVVADMGADHKVSEELPAATIFNRQNVTLNITKALDYGALTAHGSATPERVTFKLYKGVSPAEGLLDTGKSVTIATGTGERTGVITDILQLTEAEKTAGIRYYLTEETVHAQEWKLTGATAGDPGVPLEMSEAGGVTYIALPGFTDKADVSVTATNRYAKADITLKKIDQDSKEPLTGAAFALYSTDQAEAATGLPAAAARIGDFTANGDGTYTIANVPAENTAGTDYYIYEVTAPEHYVRVTQPVKVTVLPGQHASFNADDPQVAALLTVPNESGVDLSLVKHPDVYGGSQAGEIQTTGVRFDLYVRDTTAAGSTWQKVGDTRTPEAESGSIKWTGLPIKNREYALYEHEITSGEYEKYALDGVYLNGRKMATEEFDGKTLHVLSGMDAGAAYEFGAYNRPAQEVIIRKEDVNGGAAPRATFQILDENGEIVPIHEQNTITTEPVAGENYTEARVPLKAGTYTLKETLTAPEYNLIPDDTRVITWRTITIPDTANDNTYMFGNLRVSPTLALDKQVTAVNGEPASGGQKGMLENLWWNDNQTVRYSITPELGDEISGGGNNATIEAFTLTDQGLTMVNPAGEDLPGDVYAKDNYTFTSLVIPRPEHESFIEKDGQTVAAGNITARVEVQYFDGTKEIYEHEFGADSEAWKLELPADSTTRRVGGFTVTYEDAAMKAASGYALGQNFKPGTIEAEVVLYQQPYNAQAIGVIKTIRNDVNVSVSYSKYLSDGEHTVYSMGTSALADVTVLDPDIPTVATTLSVENLKRPEDTATGNIKVNDKLLYTMTLENVSEAVIKSDMVGPVFVNRLPAGVNADKDTVKVYWEGQEIAADQISLVYADDGSQYLLVSLADRNLKTGEKAVVTFEADVTSAVVNNTGAVTDNMYVTSRITKDIFAGNPGGATFKWSESAAGVNWPNEYPAVNDIAKDKLGLWQKANGFTYNYCQNTFNTNSDITLLKEGKGNLDSSFVSEPNSAKVSSDGNGSIIYHLIAKNTSSEASKTVVTRLRLADSLPRLSDIEDFKGVTRGSQWELTVDGDTQFVVYRSTGADSRTEIDPANYQIYYYTGDGQTPIDQDVLKKYSAPEAGGWTLKENWTGGHPVAVMADITLPEGEPLVTGESIVLEFKADAQKTDTAQELEAIAYTYSVNRFSMSYYYESNEQPEKLAMQDVTSNTVQAVLTPQRVGVGGRVWIDANGNGIQDDDRYGTSVSDLQKLVAANYFKVTLTTDGEESDTVAVASVSNAVPEAPNDAKRPTGAFDRTGRFLFSGLLPAQPHDEAALYTGHEDDGSFDSIRNTLNAGALKGLHPQTSRLTISTKGDESADIIPGMILRKAMTTVAAGGASNSEGGMSRKPSEIYDRFGDEARDSNFVTGGNNLYKSETFFLWGDTETWDQTKDFGLVPYRDLKLTKYGESGETLSGTKFALYGPFDDEEDAKAFDAAKADHGSAKFVAAQETGADGTLTFENLYYYLYYVIVEESAPENYMTYGATANPNIRPMSGDLNVAAWYVPWGVTETHVTDRYGTGTLKVTKVDGETEKALAGAVFTLEAVKTNAAGAWDTYLTKLEEEGLSDIQGAEITGTADGILTFVITGTGQKGAGDGTALLGELPYGTYRLTEIKAPEGYVLGDEPQTRTFTISRSDRTISYTTDRMALENDAMGPIANQPHRTEVLKVSKTNNDIRLAGAEFILKSKGRGYVLLKDGSFAGYTQDEAKAGRFTTDENGAFVIMRLPADTYTLIEKTAPSGYRINENIEPFVTDGIGHCTVKVEDQKITHSGGGGSTGGHSVKTTEIGPGEVPLAGLPESPVNETMILDEEVPLAGLPKTGEIVNAAAGLAAMISAALLGVYMAMQKKKRPGQ